MLYYAHSKQIYDTNRERQERRLIDNKFPEQQVICPNNDLGELFIMERYLDFVRRADIVVCSEFRGYVGRGVYSELQEALEMEIPCYTIRNEIIKEIDYIKVHNHTDWKVAYGKIIIK